MPETRVEYQCECGKKWSLTAKEAGTNTILECGCGRIIVVQNGVIYGPDKR
jgi:hypothetical protein